MNNLKPHDQQALQNLLASLQANYRDQLEKVILFGSKARGDDTPESDIDVLILLRHEDWRLRDTLRTLGARISLQYDVLLSVRVIPPHQWAELSRYQFPFYRAIQQEGITCRVTRDINITI